MRELGAARMFRRELLANRGAALTVMTVVFVVAALLAAWPRVLDHAFTQDVREQVADPPGIVADVSGQAEAASPVLAGTGMSADQAYAIFEKDVADIRDSAPRSLQHLLGDPEYQIVGSQREFAEGLPEWASSVSVAVIADPHYVDRIRVVEGELPTGWDRADPLDEDRFEALVEASDVAGSSSTLRPLADRAVVFDVAVSARSAERLGWEVGQTRLLQLSGASDLPTLLRLTGVFEPTDPDAAYWSHGSGLLNLVEELHSDRGILAFAHGFIAPEALIAWRQEAFTAFLWFPVDGSAMDAATAPDVLDDLQTFTGRPYSVGLVQDEQLRDSLQLRTGTIDQLRETLARQASATALVALVVAGPIGVAVAVLALVARLIRVRRGRAMALLAARGASPGRLRVRLAAEGAALGVPAAALAVAAAEWLVPGRGGIAGIALPAIVGVAPAVLLPIVAGPQAFRAERTDLRRRWHGWLRRALEGLLVGAAVASVVLLNRRGLAAGEPGREVDPLLVAAPPLVAMAVAVVTLRVYPWPVAALGRLARRRKGAVSFVGTVRAARDPAAGMAPVVALVAGLSIAVFSTVLWATTESGGESASLADVGADMRVAGEPFEVEEIRRIEQVEGVTEVAGVSEQGTAEITVGNRVETAVVYLTDTATLARVQDGLGRATPIPDGLDRAPDGVIPAMVSEQLGSAGETGVLGIAGGLDITVADVAPGIAGLTADRPWVLIDSEAFEAAGGYGERRARVLLLGLDEGTQIDRGEIARIAGPDAQLTTATDVLTEVRVRTLETFLVASFVVAVVVVGFLSAMAVLLTMVIEAPARGRLLSQLRTLGLTARQAQALVVWEILPLSLVSLVVGAGLGLGLPWLVFSALDLRPLTGGAAQPPIVVDWTLVGGAAGAFVAIVSIAVVAAVLAGRRLRLGTVLRVGEEL
ncbi:MAG: FtsX-like permease family protein [Actinomycetota bacterium]